MDWRPFRISPALSKRVVEYNDRSCPEGLSSASHAATDATLGDLLAPVVSQIISREGLPHIAHLICGWGNAVVGSRPLLSYISDFIVVSGGKPQIPQKAEGGDFHPWQTFAYCTMAAPQAFYTRGSSSHSFAEVASNSVDLNTSDNTDLGHFLYAYSYLPAAHQPEEVIFESRPQNILSLVDLAIEGHAFGGFEVCRKFHLTEGLCAVTSHARFSHRRQEVRKFLTGQLACLEHVLAIATILLINKDRQLADVPADEQATLVELRKVLVLGEAIENIYYYAGHLVELAAISIRCGYDVTTTHLTTIRRLIGALDSLLPDIRGELTFAESFYAFAHYKRGSEMILPILGLSLAPTNADQLKLDNRQRRGEALEAKAHPKDRPFTYAPAKAKPRPYFERVVAAYNATCRPGYDAKGEFPHFRKILAPGLPTGVHYEFLDCGDTVGVELHCERAIHADPLLFQRLTKILTQAGLVSAVYDPTWYSGCGRVVTRYAGSVPPSVIADQMTRFVAAVENPLIERYRSVSRLPDVTVEGQWSLPNSTLI